MQKWSPLEHSLYRNLDSQGIVQGKSLLLAVSGGLDSMVMWALMEKLSSALKCKLAVGCIHHGVAVSSEMQTYRDKALEFVRSQASEKNIPFWTAKAEKELKSEADMRDFRKSALRKIQMENNFDLTLWAHHQDDYLETQMMRLIRGTGEGGIEPMLLLRGSELRPLLEFSRKDLEKYALDHDIKYVEDPSNQDLSYLRNWLRQSWLPQLEEKCPGALRVMSRSISTILQEKEALPPDIFLDQALSKPIYLTLAPAQQKQVLAVYLKSRGQTEFNQNQILEIMKRLDNSQNEHTFKIAQMLWSVGRDRIEASPTFL